MCLGWNHNDTIFILLEYIICMKNKLLPYSTEANLNEIVLLMHLERKNSVNLADIPLHFNAMIIFR